MTTTAPATTTDAPPLSPQQRGGKARQAQLRQQLGEDGYRAFQQQQAHKSIAAQLQAGTYTENRRAGYAALVERHGADYARSVLRSAHESRRQWRLTNPTAGELALRHAMAELGFAVRLTSMPFVYATWRDGSDPAWRELAPHIALVEAYVGSYIIDVLLPHQQIAIEFVGGVHALRQAYDAARSDWLTARGFSIIELTECHLRDGSITATLRAELAAYGGMPIE